MRCLYGFLMLAIFLPSPVQAGAAALNCTLTITPSPITRGLLATVVLNVKNTGDANAKGVSPSLSVSAGASYVLLKSGPVPNTPQDIASGNSLDFTWTYSATGTGTSTFSSGAGGQNEPDSSFISCSNAKSLVINPPVPGALTCSLSYPPTALLDDTLTIVATVKNTGGTEVRFLMPSLLVGYAATLVPSACGNIASDSNNTNGYLTGPFPTGPLKLDPGQTQLFTWTNKADAEAPDWKTKLTARFDGIEGLLVAPYTGCATGAVGISPPVSLYCSLATSPQPVNLGKKLTVTAVVFNNGSNDLAGILPQLAVGAGADRVKSDGTATAPADIAVGASHAWSWVFTAIKNGTVYFTAAATGTLGPDSATTSCSNTAEIQLFVDRSTVKLVGGVRGYINTKKGEQAEILVKPDAPGSISARIFDMKGRLVRELDASTPGGRTESLKWDGRDSAGARVAPGEYPVIVTAPGGLTYRNKLLVLR